LNITSTAWIFKHFGITFHRVNQWCNAAKDLRCYPSLQHACHANNERKSIQLQLIQLTKQQVYNTSESVSQSGSSNNNNDDDNSDEDDDTNNQRSTCATANATPQAVQLPPSSFKSGKTPKKRKDLPQDFETQWNMILWERL